MTFPAMPLSLRFWPVTLILALLPVWGVGLFARGLWTPDEPREAAIAGAMADGAGWAVPVLAGVPFCEKPPLTYWLAGASISIFGRNPPAARIPNLLWAALAVLAVGGLAAAAAGGGRSGAVAGLVAGLAMGTSELTAQVLIWLASDAPLTTGVCVTLFGAWRGLNATTTRSRLGWYLLMHAGLALGFLAKNIVAWVFPGLAFVAFLVWEWRFRELLRWELWIGFGLQAVLIGPWIWGVAQHPDARQLLKVFFYDNLVGRFIPVEGVSYQDGHRNWLGKYLVELPAFLLPWTFLAAAAVRRAWAGCLIAGPDRAGWRFAVAALVPAIALLSVSNTARGIYLAPVLPGMMVAIGLWAARHGGQPDRFERGCLWGTGALVVVLAILGPVAGQGLSMWWQGVALNLALVVDAGLWVGGIFLTGLAVRRALIGHWAEGAALLGGAVALALVGGISTGLAVVDRWQDPAPMTRAMAEIAKNGPVAIYQPDETTLAALDWQERLRPNVLTTPAQVVALVSAQPNVRILVKQPRSGPGGPGQSLLDLGLLEVQRLDIPGGRRHALFARKP